MPPYLGDFDDNQTVHFMWSSNGADGASITRATNGTVSVYKDNGLTQSTTGVTDTEDFDTLTGVHVCTILTTDAFYATGSNYTVILSGATIDGVTVDAVLAHFSILNRSPLRPTTAGRTLDVATTGEAGVDFSNINGTLDAAEIGSGAITSAKIATGAIVPAAFAAGAINAAAIAADAVHATALSSGALADINAEVLDVLQTDTFAEVGQETPVATQSILKMMQYLYKAWRNKTTQDNSAYKLYAEDESTVDQKATVSKAGGTFTREEVGTGP